MTLAPLEKIALGISGATALGVGACLLLAPHAFLASHGIALGNDPSLLSELRAPAAGLAALGMAMLAGIVRHGWAGLSIAVALIVFLAFPAGRLVGIVADGMPSGGILGALVLELAIAGLCLAAFRKRLSPAAPARHASPAA